MSENSGKIDFFTDAVQLNDNALSKLAIRLKLFYFLADVFIPITLSVNLLESIHAFRKAKPIAHQLC